MKVSRFPICQRTLRCRNPLFSGGIAEVIFSIVLFFFYLYFYATLASAAIGPTDSAGCVYFNFLAVYRQIVGVLCAAFPTPGRGIGESVISFYLYFDRVLAFKVCGMTNA